MTPKKGDLSIAFMIGRKPPSERRKPPTAAPAVEEPDEGDSVADELWEAIQDGDRSAFISALDAYVDMRIGKTMSE